MSSSAARRKSYWFLPETLPIASMPAGGLHRAGKFMRRSSVSSDRRGSHAGRARNCRGYNCRHYPVDRSAKMARAVTPLIRKFSWFSGLPISTTHLVTSGIGGARRRVALRHAVAHSSCEADHTAVAILSAGSLPNAEGRAPLARRPDHRFAQPRAGEAAPHVGRPQPVYAAPQKSTWPPALKRRGFG